MAEYKNAQSILNAALGDYQQQGFRLVEPDDHTLVLYHDDYRVCTFSASGADIPTIRAACDIYLRFGLDRKN